MIKGKRKVELSAKEILSKISYYDIYRKYVGDFKLNEAIANPFRDDHTPSFIIGNKYGEIIHTDFADSFWRGNAIQLVEQINGCNHDRALRIIDEDFNLGISSGKFGTEYKQITSQYKQPESLGKRYSLIQVVTRKFNNKELDYWKDYHQDEADLRHNRIYVPKEIYINKKRYPVDAKELIFGYLYTGGYWKIYRPFAEKKRKWISNVPIGTAYGLENLDSNHNTLICKSLKDYMVCRKVYNNVCHVQNESLAAFSDETVRFIQENSKRVFYGGDSDEPGKKASFAITEAFGFKHINAPDRLLPESNDFAAWAKREGLEVLEEHFIKKQLL